MNRPPAASHPSPLGVPPRFLSLARTVSHHRSPDRWPLLYRTLYRLTHTDPHLLQISIDDDTRQLELMEKSVTRDAHKAKAFVRFKKLPATSPKAPDRYLAFHRPDHYILPLVADHFADRFASMHWLLLTPDESLAWDCEKLHHTSGAPTLTDIPDDGLEDLWRTYYANIFNPARLNVRAMKKELPARHWPTLPEAALIPDLVRKAPELTEAMMAKQKQSACKNTGSAADFLPEKLSLPQLRAAAENCKGCDLYCNATQVVFGEGPSTAAVMFVGEQPGDKEDLAGKPFVGPSGQLLDRALEQVGIDRSTVYVTNAVKHFKFEPRGTRRIHAKPNAREIAACRPWLESEIETVRPKLIVCLGATAAQSLLGAAFRITQSRGQLFEDTRWAPALIATNHPSAILRVPDAAAREKMHEQFVHDLKLVARQIDKISRAEADAHAKKLREAQLRHLAQEAVDAPLKPTRSRRKTAPPPEPHPDRPYAS